MQASSPNGTGTFLLLKCDHTDAAEPRPSHPRASSAQPATGQALVSWTPPSNNGGSTITGYTITPYVGTVAQALVTVTGSATSATIKISPTKTPTRSESPRPNAIGTAANRPRSAPVSPENTIFDFATPDNVESSDSNLDRARRQVHLLARSAR